MTTAKNLRPTGDVPRLRGSRVRHRFEVGGHLEGMGFRPFVYVTASRLGLSGAVTDTASGVVVEVEGEDEAIAAFRRRLVEDAPSGAAVTRVEESDITPRGGTGFTIARTAGGAFDSLVSHDVSPDVSVCADCLAELADPHDRRYRHPFISCTNCGPRFTIMTALPYDRATTTMAGFEMCDACRTEYDDPAGRRFRAQPIACHDCGPTLELVGPGVSESGEAALAAVRGLLADGRIVAVKGLGGYHLACNARDEPAVSELRRRTRRGNKPFAVMVRDRDVARRIVTLDDPAMDLLDGFRKPMVLVPRVPGTGVADAVAPGNPELGVMLPHTPLHTLLIGDHGLDVLVMTSGNISGGPIVTDDDEALHRLVGLADAWLRHDRPIQVPCEDSIARVVDGVELPIRRSRGHAPLPVVLPFAVAPVLASGADLKNTCAVASGRYAWLSQHIGDLDDPATQDVLGASARHLEELTGVRPEVVVADYHPAYRSTAWARLHAAGRPVRTVQHHHAHVASVMGEHGLGPDATVIGVVFDGAGYGLDGAVWGGEVLVACYKSFRRVAHLSYVSMAGGQVNVQRPYRMALSHLRSAGVPWADDIPAVAACPATERDALTHQLDTGLGCVPTSSMGRLFDAVASLVGVRHVADYEAAAAIELESLSREFGRGAEPYIFGVDMRKGVLKADAAAVVFSVVDDLRNNVSVAEISARFHAGVAALVVELAERERERSGLDVVALSGGVFANSWLLGAALERLRAAGFRVLRPELLPPDDGGIALGQILVGSAT